MVCAEVHDMLECKAKAPLPLIAPSHCILTLTMHECSLPTPPCMPELDDRRPSFEATAPVCVRRRLDGGATAGGGVGVCPSAVMAVGGTAAEASAAWSPTEPLTEPCTPGAGGTTSSILPEELVWFGLGFDFCVMDRNCGPVDRSLALGEVFLLSRLAEMMVVEMMSHKTAREEASSRSILLRVTAR